MLYTILNVYGTFKRNTLRTTGMRYLSVVLLFNIMKKNVDL